MKERRIRFTETAQTHVQREQEWWGQHRVHSQLFIEEFEQALRTLTLLPGAGTSYPLASTPGLRRVYLEKVACHIYYTFDDREVIVRAMWGARRGRGPFSEG